MLILTASCGGGRKAVVADTAESARLPHTSATEAPALEVGIRQAGSKPRLLGTMAYECEDSSFVVAQLDAATGGLWVFLPEETVLLPHVPAASGAHYSNGVVSLWSKGNTATIEVRETLRRCAENRRRSVIEDAKLRGNDFWATGNEPGWNLEIGPEFTVLRADYGQTIYTMRTPSPQVDEDGRRATYEFHVDGVEVRLVIDGMECHDSMSGESFESSVTVTVGDTTLYGCGQALH